MQQDTTQARRDPRAEVIEDTRPWGRFEQFTHNEVSTVKLITVAPGQRLSLQVHEHRDELWVVTRGPVTAQVGDEVTTVGVGERVWIPRGVNHRLGNEVSTVKLITVAPGQRLSLQVHEHRDELWVVTRGPVTAQVGDEVSTVGVGERVWIPRGVNHRLGNEGTEEGQVLEVAFGTFDEADIERLEDDYSRG